MHGGNKTNDLWRYNLKTNNWTWMNGSPNGGSITNYGIKCIASPNNVPPRRFENRAAWTDDDGNFWTFGGGSNWYNDLWVYCWAINQWTWVSNDSVAILTCDWGSKGVSSPTNKPGGRSGALGWYDHNKHLYLFGGHGPYANSVCNNDLWVYAIDSSCQYCSTINQVKLLKKSPNEISIYPNPVLSSFLISLDKDIEDGTVVIFNSIGMKVYSDIFNGEQKYINVDLARGIYLVEVTYGTNRWAEKIIKE